ncbi:MAG: tetratricopeptide repeat protein [Muribaculaceae bacterium]|nr:tetratricopeptide repeat protein [Muribaculaceae bacterium]MDY6413478.1 tetratricopeptide repeat protein [Bacteroidales bacterium]
MKTKFFFATMLIAGAALVVNAQGYKDGIDFYKIGKLDDAQELLERNLDKAETNKAEAYYYLGQVALKKGDTGTAKSYYDKGVQANPNFALNYVGQGAVALKNGNAKEAENLFKQAEKLAKKDPKLAIAIANAYYMADANAYAKQIDKQKKNAFKWNANDPDYYIFVGDDLAHKQEWGQAAGQYELAFQREPANIESRVKFSNVDFFLNENRAVEALEELLDLVPNSALVQRELAEKYYEASSIKGNVGKAVEHYGTYYNNPNHFAKDEIRYAQLLWMSKDFDKAEEVCDGLIANATDPSNKFFGYRLKFYSQCGEQDWEDAAETGAKFFALPANERTPYSVTDYSYYATALNRTNRGAEAVATFEKAIQQYPDNADLRSQLANVYNASKDYVKAAEVLQGIVDSGNYDAADLYRLANAYRKVADNTTDDVVKQNAISKARSAINGAIEKEPNDLSNLNMLAQVELSAENNEYTGGALNAYKNLIDAVNKNPGDENANYYYMMGYRYLATYYSKQGQMPVAKDYYIKWLQYDPENENLRKFVEQLK